MLQVVQLEGMEKRKPQQLSGGQQQRVALARALVNRPAALLLDEPLGALDVKLRKQMQLELKRIQNELGTTFVYVTHDQEEALTMSRPDRGHERRRHRANRRPERDLRASADTVRRRLRGLLNAFDLRVDEVADGLAVMRVGERSGSSSQSGRGRRRRPAASRGAAGTRSHRADERARARRRIDAWREPWPSSSISAG